MLTPGYQHTYSENKNNNILARKNTIFVIFGFERLKFLPNDDRSIDNGFALQLCLGISLTQEHETATKRKSNVLHDSRACSDNCLLIRTDYGTKQGNFFQMWRRSPQRFFVSVLCFVVVDRGAVFENGIDKQENRDERTANFGYGKPHQDRITADDCPQQ